MNIEVDLRMHCPYTQELIQSVLAEQNGIFTLRHSSASSSDKILYWLEYEEIDFDMLYRSARHSDGKKILANSFCIRKGLLRKANFASFVQRYLSKVPEGRMSSSLEE